MHNPFMDIVLYTRDAELDSDAMRDHLTWMGVPFQDRAVDHDAGARRDWERIDGLVTPVLVIDRTVVRGLDRTQVDQILGMVGC